MKEKSVCSSMHLDDEFVEKSIDILSYLAQRIGQRMTFFFILILDPVFIPLQAIVKSMSIL